MFEKSLFGRRLRRALGVIFSIPGWIVLSPIAFCFPRKREWVAIISSRGNFVDNTKYFYLESQLLLEKSTCCVLITTNKKVYYSLHQLDLPVMLYPSIESIRFLLRAGSVVVDASDWAFGFRRFLVFGAHLIQLWHGVGFKRINRMITAEMFSSFGVLASVLRLLRSLATICAVRDVRYDIFCAPSIFYRDQVFTQAFRSRNFLLSAYPRNTFGQGLCHRFAAAVWCSVDPLITLQLSKWIQDKKRIVIVAPTFRDTRSSPLQLDPDTLYMIDCWCITNRVEIIFKFHPNEIGIREVKGTSLHCCDPNSDLYPLFPYASSMITDYSSICTDFLIVDKPIIFFLPDIETYRKHDRSLQDDHELGFPGPQATNWHDVLDALRNQMDKDEWKWRKQRRWLRDRAFEGRSPHESTATILRCMKEYGYIQ